MNESSGYTVLVVEDDPNHQLLIRQALARGNRDFALVQLARNPEDAERFARQMDFDCLLVDNRIPGLRGLDLISSLRKEGITGPFVLMTSAGNEDLAVQAYRGHCAEYIIKDTDFWRRLPTLLKEVIEKDRAERGAAKARERLERTNAQLSRMNTEVQIQNQTMRSTQRDLGDLCWAVSERLKSALSVDSGPERSHKLDALVAELDILVMRASAPAEANTDPSAVLASVAITLSMEAVALDAATKNKSTIDSLQPPT